MIDYSKFNISKEEYQLIAKIAAKAVKLFSEYNLTQKLDHMTMVMDLEVVHAHVPLRLEEMLNSDSPNFMHDIIEIHNNLNRDTGELENCFHPRFAK